MIGKKYSCHSLDLAILDGVNLTLSYHIKRLAVLIDIA